MFTFSQLVDDLVSETRRPDMITDIGRFVNQTIRELHFSSDRNAATVYRDNFRELQLVAPAESGFTWTQPAPELFQKMACVQYPDVRNSLGEVQWAKCVTPGPHVRQYDCYYYQVGQTYVFSGYGGLNARINLGYFEFPRSLVYEPPGECRPAEFDPEKGWAYNPAGGWNESDCLKEQARELTTNWLLMRWHDVVAEGVRAKIYKRLSDEGRQRTSYSLFKQLALGLYTSETMVEDF